MGKLPRTSTLCKIALAIVTQLFNPPQRRKKKVRMKQSIEITDKEHWLFHICLL